MATIYRMQQADKVESRGLFSSHTGNVYIEHMRSEDNLLNIMRIYAASPTTSHFNTGPDIGSEIIDTASGVKYRKTAATTWATVTQA